jgi:hypothetical protein
LGRQRRDDCEFLVDSADAQPLGAARITEIVRFAENSDAPTAGDYSSGDDAEEGRFARSVFTDQGMNETLFSLDTNAV